MKEEIRLIKDFLKDFWEIEIKHAPWGKLPKRLDMEEAEEILSRLERQEKAEAKGGKLYVATKQKQ
ncbi:MAG: hypothetical protein KDD28_15165 [Phaeodactylibacter sp.]|nr:hypothetical protein [Phaeodactylibacter sp.]